MIKPAQLGALLTDITIETNHVTAPSHCRMGIFRFADNGSDTQWRRWRYWHFWVAERRAAADFILHGCAAYRVHEECGPDR